MSVLELPWQYLSQLLLRFPNFDLMVDPFCNEANCGKKKHQKLKFRTWDTSINAVNCHSEKRTYGKGLKRHGSINEVYMYGEVLRMSRTSII